ncbi:MAG: hypothetical protein A2700_02215 [Candidatus Blackburnbacteria bacterium RIFCSPHIGHO2_01_FULL_44_64]|uniref:DUF5673 domain-containing protein n=1 Tax=Candidatus Blackburnbacteria bacterium RIFCSPHIGHO2_02_FULL_44_20 TaxID=1797516 RepID=A0A1G1V5K0_9BACT|nr:MAG: hypothetical protein A2700_02215 [Candidatus Blackburnbacteria bacterium RIFCSPHIGHO2_01_FULL_44_64]OGY10562.1 MAG: hypothetical protein A3D26_00500 [Candidatus Blackburnbacteria bacterium RIFCSPHIGHO2_02_FULL_44_20]OGY11648.1 MAG: hypothetical protein A3E16_01475 [Candidatus Blackburnbacteria bacterium RIFCSPHIGHO2_12_FULL_44_25]OGY13910.1 MAG: hypothetical protein A3A62_02420 [Candidatus Blackburnbacteria bacterium RIFCSPLOWO2_01_FULL_44_43]
MPTESAQTPGSETRKTPTVIGSAKELFSWQAHVRPFKKRNKEFFTTVLAVAFLVGVIFFTIGGILPVIVIISLVFLVYTLSTVSPEEVEHKITTKGIIFAGKAYFWDELIRFWFTERFGNQLLVVEAIRMPWRLEFVINPEDKDKIRQVLEEYIVYEEAAPGFLDKSASWLSKRIPLES